jgi:tRNA pseudouridine13 synthase
VSDWSDGRGSFAADPAAAAPLLPLATAELPGSGGAPREPEDFVVEEIPAYEPCGEGAHCFALIEKRGLTTPQAIARIARALELPAAAAGYAGLKDRAAVTRQWISLEGARPDALAALALDGVRVLAARLHRNKLRTGHLRGNRFTIVLRGVHDGALARARAVLGALAAGGLPNYYGAQRFGRDGANARRGLELLRGGRERDRTRRRLLVSALQSLLFNELLARRVAERALRVLLGGEVLQRVDSGGLFVSDDRARDQARLARGELVVTGPICGPRMPLPLAGSPALALEEEVFAAHGLTPASFAALGRLARGGRRPLEVQLSATEVAEIADDAGRPALRLEFALPAGAYATTLLREVAKRDLSTVAARAAKPTAGTSRRGTGGSPRTGRAPSRSG